MYAHDDVIYLVAPTGHPNFGDEYIAAAWLRTLARRRPRSRVVLDCPNPGMVGVLHAGLHPRLTVTDTLFRLAEAARHGIPEGDRHWADAARRAEEAAAGHHVLGAVAPHLEAGLGLLRSASTIHALGGGWVNDIWPDKSVVLAAASAVAEQSRAARGGRGAVRLLATGMGLAPAGLYDESMHRIWPRFDLIDVRDEASESIARTAVGGDGAEASGAATRITYSGDDAWVVLASGDLEDNGLGAGEGTPGRDRPIVLCLQGDLLAGRDAEGGTDESRESHESDAHSGAEDPVTEASVTEDSAAALADAVIDVLRGWEVDGRPVSGRDIAVVEAIPHVDVRVWHRIEHRAPDLAEGAYVVRFAELWDRGLPARPGQRWLTTRFHPHLIAAARGASGVALDVHVHGYYSVKHGSVVAAGSRWPVVSLDDVAVAEPGPGISDAAVERNRAAKAATVEMSYPAHPVVEGLTNAAVTVRRAGRALQERIRGAIDDHS